MPSTSRSYAPSTTLLGGLVSCAEAAAEAQGGISDVPCSGAQDKDSPHSL